MGGISSSFVDCVQDCDTQRLKQQLLARVTDVEEDELTMEELHNEVEDAIHAALSMEVTTPHQYQQLQIALELLLHVAPSALQSFECNNTQWTALHRACVTGNLSFVAFLFHRYADQIHMQRDAYGLLPVDLVPPELTAIAAAVDDEEDGGQVSTATMEIKALPSTDRERIVLALQMLRRAKAAAQRRVLSAYLPEKEVTNQDQGEADDDMNAIEDPTAMQSDNCIAFEPSREHLSPDRLGCVHQLQSPLRLRYRFPNKEPFLHGYFQLIWRADDEPRSEEPHYEHHLLLQDCLDLDHSPTQSQDLESNQRETRRLHDDGQRSSTSQGLLTGCVPIDVSHLAEDTVCHVLFVASDKHLMKREIVMSTEGVRLVRADSLDALDHRVQVEEPYEEAPYEFDIDSDGEVDGFVFHVAGEAFTHPSEQLAGRSFETLEEFEGFVKELRASKRGEATKEDPATVADSEDKAAAEARPPSVSSNQDEDGGRASDDSREQFVHVDIKQVGFKQSNQDECEQLTGTKL